MSTLVLADGVHSSPQKLNPQGYYKTFARSGNAYIAGQPSKAAIKELKSHGITAVINLRTSKEMTNTKKMPYDESSEVAAQGLDYISIPMNGTKPYSELMLDQFIKAYDANEGRVLLHCRSGKRASQMWTAFLVKHEGMSLTEATKIGEQIYLDGAPMNGLLGQETKEKAHQ